MTARREGRAIGFVTSLAVHLATAAIAISIGVFRPPADPREARAAVEGRAEPGASAAAGGVPRAAAPRKTLVPRAPESPGHPRAGAAGKPDGTADYAIAARGGFVDAPRGDSGRWAVVQAILHFARKAEPRGSALVDHLWQSTLFVIAAAIVSLAFRRNRAEVRYWIWFAASIKFLVPFSLLAAFGARLPGAAIAQTFVERTLAPASVRSAVPESLTSAPWTPSAPELSLTNWLVVGLAAIWACGAMCLVLTRLHAWLQIRRVVLDSPRLELRGLSIPASVEVRAAVGLLEPGVVGWSRPVLLMPAGIDEHLTGQQLDTVVAHELCHVRRQDNLTAAIQMAVETLFWFHPFVWWIGARLLDERERACDEAVLRTIDEPHVYAEAILNVCKQYVESPLVCVAGVSGSSITKRIEAILRNDVGMPLTWAKRGLVAAAGLAAIALPVGAGVMSAPRLQAHMEVRSVPVFALVRVQEHGQDGPRLNQSAVDCRDARAAGHCVAQSVPGRISGRGVTTAQLAEQLSAELKTPVVDRTSLAGRFDIDLEWATDRTAPGSIFVALREQLGLALEPTTAPIEVVVIEDRTGRGRP